MAGTPVNPEFVERYQLEYQKNPRSKVFAPLAEAYRKMGLLDEALTVAQAGVKHHPDFASGRVVFARVLLEQKNLEGALEQLMAAARLSPDNLMAHALIGDTYLQLRRPKDALTAFKMVLFIDPNNEKARAAVRKWEFLTADEYDDALFEFEPKTTTRIAPIGTLADRSDSNSATSGSANSSVRDLERALSLADAFTVRNDIQRAFTTLKDARTRFGSSPELNNRLALLARRLGAPNPTAIDPSNDTTDKVHSAAPVSPEREHLLKDILRRIQDRRLDRPPPR